MKNRSQYLDDMDVLPGDIIICKDDIINTGFTPNKAYKVMPNKMLIDDKGNLVIPSARFYERKNNGCSKQD